MEKIFNDAVTQAFDEKRKLTKNKGVAKEMLKENETKLFGNMPKAFLRLYGIDSFTTGIYFTSEEELLRAIVNYEIGIWSNLVVLEYFPEYASRKDVIIKINREGKREILALESTNELRKLNVEESLVQGMYVWEIVPGTLRKEYDVLRNYGINFSHDLYAEEDKLQEIQRRNLYKETFKG